MSSLITFLQLITLMRACYHKDYDSEYEFFALEHDLSCCNYSYFYMITLAVSYV